MCSVYSFIAAAPSSKMFCSHFLVIWEAELRENLRHKSSSKCHAASSEPCPRVHQESFPLLSSSEEFNSQVVFKKNIYTTYSLIIRIKDRNSTEKLFNSVGEWWSEFKEIKCVNETGQVPWIPNNPSNLILGYFCFCWHEKPEVEDEQTKYIIDSCYIRS